MEGLLSTGPTPSICYGFCTALHNVNFALYSIFCTICIMKCTLVHTECGKDVGEIMKIAAMKSVANKFHNPRVAFLTGSKLNCTAL